MAELNLLTSITNKRLLGHSVYNPQRHRYFPATPQVIMSKPEQKSFENLDFAINSWQYSAKTGTTLM